MATFMQVGDVYVKIIWIYQPGSLIYQPGSLKAEFQEGVQYTCSQP
jgi:hypothetical protein